MAKKAAKTKKGGRYVVVTTDKDRRGVFAGYLERFDEDKGIVILSQARMFVHWSIDTKGVLGLAAIGPQKGSLTSPAVPKIQLDGVTAVMDCSKKAKKEIEKGIWDD